MLRVFCNIFGEKIQKRLHFSVVGAGQYNLSIRLKREADFVVFSEKQGAAVGQVDSTVSVAVIVVSKKALIANNAW